jgi:uncharacterized protein YdeI (YjbR/CyaY-like superfamily)
MVSEGRLDGRDGRDDSIDPSIPPSLDPSIFSSMPRPTFFSTPADLNRWLKQHHAAADELWVGFHKRATGKPSITWPESVDEALCYGWIDGIRKSLGAESYMIRFTPRRPGSHWSQINISKARALIEQRRMRPAGKAFDGRDSAKTKQYSFENRPTSLPPTYLRLLKADRDAWAFFQAQPAGYRRTCAWWIMSAKKEETRRRRIGILLESSAKRRRVPPLTG